MHLFYRRPNLPTDGLSVSDMHDEKRFLRNLKRQIKRTGNRKRRRYLKNIDAPADAFDLGRDRTDVMNERPARARRRSDNDAP